MIVPSVDIYVTYRCNLRCSHCFVGDNLNLNSHFDFEDLRALLDHLHIWQTEEVTFLGGEPTLYLSLIEAVKLVQFLGLEARIVTNGLHGFAHFMEHFDGTSLPYIGFSLDGSGPEYHDLIRGRGNFSRLMINIQRSRSLGYRSFCIISVSRENSDDILPTLDLCNDVGFDYVNIHYVTNRGFATSDMVLSIKEWRDLYQIIQEYSRTLKIDIRIENTFVPQTDFSGSCAVREQNNLMFFPDGRVFTCAMFIDKSDAHSYTWTKQGLIANESSCSEQAVCAHEFATHCPAMRYVNPTIQQQAEQFSCAITCIYEKVRLRRGVVI